MKFQSRFQASKWLLLVIVAIALWHNGLLPKSSGAAPDNGYPSNSPPVVPGSVPAPEEAAPSFPGAFAHPKIPDGPAATPGPEQCISFVNPPGQKGDPPEGLPETGLLDNLSLFLGMDGSKGPEDLGINANLGFRGAVNWGYPLLERYGLGVQLGTAFNYGRNAVGVLQTIDGTRDRTQSFSTVGLFQRTDFGLNWGVAYDVLYEDYYANFTLTQWRGQVGYAVGSNDEFGVWGAAGDREVNTAVDGKAFRLKPIVQGDVFWRHAWATAAITRIWVGVAEEHGKFVFVLPDHPPGHDQVEFGADAFMPLNDWLALFGEANFLTPPASGTVTATFGLAFFPGGGAKKVCSSRFAPLLPLANNSSFSVDLER